MDTLIFAMFVRHGIKSTSRDTSSYCLDDVLCNFKCFLFLFLKGLGILFKHVAKANA
jgi:hypothetical protein